MNFEVKNQTIKSADTTLVSGSVNFYTASFKFDESWAGYTKIAVFQKEGGSSSYNVLLVNNQCTVPWEVLTQPGYLNVGVYGTQGSTIKPTIWCSPIFVEKGTGSAQPTQASPDIYEALQDEIEAVDDKIGNLQDLETTDKSSVVSAINEVASATGAPAVLYTPQTLTDAQKQQARTNIGANDIIPTWDNISGKPSTFPPSSHNHNDLYYTETEIDNKLTEKQDAANNSSLATLDKTIVGAINEVNAKAGGQTGAKVITGGYQQLVAAANDWGRTELSVGSNVYLTQTNIPDVWVSSVGETASTYTFTTNQQFMNDMDSGDAICGYFQFRKLETEKPDLSDVVRHTSTITATGSGNAVTGMSIDNAGNIALNRAYTFVKTDDNIDASKIASGTLGVDRIPDLAASKITSGTIGADRLPLATSSANGAMSYSDKAKLDTVGENANETNAANVENAGAIMKTAQSLLAPEKAQARENIGATTFEVGSSAPATLDSTTIFFVI